jgi:hypothetical protein
MANSNINWLGNPVLNGGSSRNSTRTAPIYQFLTSQDSPTDVTIDTQNELYVIPQSQQGPPPVSDIGYIPYYLESNIGKNIRAEFVIGTSYVDKTGKLIEVGVNYFVIEDFNSRTHIMCDLYSVKFVTVLQM